MSTMIALAGQSGTGKSSSIRTLNPAETFIINVASKPLPFKGWRSKYTIWNKDNPNGNYINTSNVSTISSILNYINTKRPEVKNVILEDVQYIMGFEYMDRALEKGFAKFSEIGQKFYSVLKAGIGMRDDLNIIMTCHTENTGTNDAPQYKIKTIGRMLDEKITIEGLFTHVLFTSIQRDDDDKPVYMFQTHSDGTNTCKTPMGCFEEDYIPNDLQYVIDKIAEYDA